MKKQILIFVIFFVVCSICFADKIWQFESGSRKIDFQTFSSIKITNETGRVLKINGRVVDNNTQTFLDATSVEILSEAFNCHNFEAAYAVKNERLEILIFRRQPFRPHHEFNLFPPPRKSPPAHHHHEGHPHRKPAPIRGQCPLSKNVL